MQRIKKGDNVVVINGKDRGNTGEVLRVSSDSGKAVVQNINLVTKNVRPKKAGEKGEQVSIPASVDTSNLKPVCDSCKKGVRVGYKQQKNGKVRICKSCGKKL